MVQLKEMYPLKFLLVIIFSWTLCEIVVIKKEENKIYKGHVLFEVEMPMWSICAQYCSRVKVCKSINFIAWNKTCQINDAEPGISECELRESFGNSFIAASSFPQNLAGQCTGNDCNLDEVCMPNGKKYFCAPLPLKLFERSTHIRPRDCSDLPQGSQSGVYTICPTNETFDVYCDMNTVGFGWTVFQSRMNGTVDFFKGWCEYEIGFGNLKSEFWLGNKLINLLTSSGNYKLYIHLEDFNGNSRYAEYSEFSVGDDTANYTLKISGFSGNAGDSMMFGGSFDHNGMMFSTKDRDNDKSASIDCATDCNGGWWYNSCHGANLNGAYLGPIYSNLCNGVIWYAWKREYISLKTTKMMIKRQ